MNAGRAYTIEPHLDGQTVSAALRQLAGPLSWAEARRLIASRHVRVNGTLCLDDARRLSAGERVELFAGASDPVVGAADVRIVHVDPHLVIVDKPPGVQTVRRIEERGWSEQRKARQPVLLELVESILHRGRAPDRRKAHPARLRAVHRLDHDTSGLMLFARTVEAEQALVRMFAAHEVRRVYHAVVHGSIREPRTFDSWLVRDRGDGLRGSVPAGARRPPDAQRAITHVRPMKSIGGGLYTQVECRLETGRTHQIRIHLAEAGHMLCGERVYVRPAPDAPVVEDRSGALRQALHSAELELLHPIEGAAMRFCAEPPRDLSEWLAALRQCVTPGRGRGDGK